MTDNLQWLCEFFRLGDKDAPRYTHDCLMNGEDSDRLLAIAEELAALRALVDQIADAWSVDLERALPSDWLRNEIRARMLRK